MKKGCISQICKAEAAYNKAIHYDNKLKNDAYHKEVFPLTYPSSDKTSESKCAVKL